MPVLITAGLSPEAHRLQRILNTKDVLFADQSPLPQIPGTRSAVLPKYNSPSFIHEILKASLDNDITAVYPLKWGEIAELSKARALFFEYNVTLIIPSENWLQNARYKKGGNSENIFVMENGILKAGKLDSGASAFQEGTGVFWYDIIEQETVYGLYLEDAGI